MLKGRGRDARPAVPAHLQNLRSTAPHRLPFVKPEPDYEVVEFPSEQYVNAKLQPPPTPPRPPTGHPAEAGASCGLCGGGGARVRCAECGRRALCASCDDMYHRHPKRRHHQRQAISQSQLRDERPPLPPKVAPPVPPPRRHKMSGDRSSASPRPPTATPIEQRRATITSLPVQSTPQIVTMPHNHAPQRVHQIPPHLQAKVSATSPTPSSSYVGSMPYIPSSVHHATPVQAPQTNTLGHFSSWGRPRGSLSGFNAPSNMGMQTEWDVPENVSPPGQAWGRPLRRGASVLELGGGAPCAGCAHCAPMPWRYGSCASLDHQWVGGWPPSQACCVPPHTMHGARPHPHPHQHLPQTPQPYRRVESRAVSRVASRAGSRATSPAISVRSRTSRRKHRTPSPPPLPSSDADSESESENDRQVKPQNKDHLVKQKVKANSITKQQIHEDYPVNVQVEEDSLGPVPMPPSESWECEHCTYVNDAGVRVCAVCCRTPIAVPKTVPIANDVSKTVNPEPTILNTNMARLKIAEENSLSPSHSVVEDHRIKNGNNTSRVTKERTSTACGPSPPRENTAKTNRLTTPTHENSRTEQTRIRHDMAVGPSPPREANAVLTQNSTRSSTTIKQTPERHSVSVGPSPPRENSTRNSPSTFSSNTGIAQKKSTGTSPPKDAVNSRLTRTNVSNTGTSPPPQSISTQTYEVPNSWERSPSVQGSRSRPRRRFRDESRRERSHSRHSLSSDTRESDRSVRTSGGRWEWREPRDSSPGGEWSESERRAASRLTRRASHLDLRRGKPTRRSSFYGSEAASPEPLSTNRTLSLEAIAGAGIKREAERGLELARLMNEAERLGFSAAEVHAALAQNPVAPLSWLRERWPSLCEGVRAAAARLAPGAIFSELEARAALARHRGSMWPAVTDCVERHRRQAEVVTVGEEGRLRGHVWGSPAGADDDAAPPPGSFRRLHRTRAEDSSDEYEAPTTTKFQDDDWMYLPLDTKVINSNQTENNSDKWKALTKNPTTVVDNTNEITEDVARKLKSLLIQAGIPTIDENLLLRGLLADNNATININNNNVKSKNPHKPIDFGQSENDFIDAYNALTRSSPLPSIKAESSSHIIKENTTMSIELKTSTVNTPEQQTSKNDTSQIQSKPKEPYTDSNSNKDHHENIEQPSREVKPKLVSEMKKKYSGKNVSTDKEIPSNELVMNYAISPITNKVSNIKDSSSKYIEDGKEEDKPNNLSDMVDNTQKLIQQMKEEINSDINSMDGRNMSQSEVDNTSNESSTENESSYSERSDTDNETGDLTSDENETSSAEEEVFEKEKRSPTKIERTSSEENEQFEEAIDHLDAQIEDFKQTNIEILDSIAKSLQEEHTISLELNTARVKQQDVNNNVFMKVNTFEEIYDELDDVATNISKINPPVTQSNGDKSQSSSIKNGEGHFQQANPAYSKQDIYISVFEMKSPTKLIINEYNLPILNALVENFDESPITNEDFQEIKNSDKSSNQNVNDSEIVNVHLLENHNNIELNHIEFQTDNNAGKKSESRSSSSEKETNDTNSVNAIPYIDSRLSSSPKSENNKFVTNLNDNDNKVPEENVNNITNVIFGSSEEQNNVLIPDQNDIHNRNEKTSRIEIKTIDQSGEILPERTSDNTINKSFIPAKSNIPKLIRVLQNNKQKSDTKIAKVIASKVPIRRASIKHYPAPSPPKTHFGNIQSGHVKKLQTRLFHNTLPKSATIPVVTDEVKASTSSSLTKRKPAPLPPSKHQEQKQLSPPKTSPPKEKKNNYFRETCRTEDEWTESDSDDSQSQIVKTNEEPERAPSPTPPITVRRVSGQMIDLARVRLPEGSPERQARMLLAEGATENWEQAQLAVELVKRGADPVAALMAALECADLESALAYLHQDCELCASRLPEHEMVSMLACTHRCCRECAHHYFTVQITERSIVDCVCPYCKEPELEDLPEDAWLDYFAHLDILLKTLLENDVHELFQRKLRDRTLARDPNFRWCVECSSGFFVHPKQKKLRCPECRSVSCATCRKPWSANHEGLSCEQYAVWLEDNDPERSVAAVQQHLRENGLECPRCKFRYSLSRGGCMHFTCTQCKYEFCYGCGKPFMMGARCGLSEYCSKLGLHAHHPRNCLFYLRDKEPHELQTLLQMNNVTYEIEAAQGSMNRCPIQLQRETPTGLVDGVCGGEVPQKHAGLCKPHYVEYLAGLARGLDPIPIMEVSELVAELRRRALPLPERGPWDTDPIYAGMCAEIVKEKIPLD